jgi:hypothetical protein
MLVITVSMFDPQALAADEATSKLSAEGLAVENEQARLAIDGNGRVSGLSFRSGENLLDQPGVPLMALQIDGGWHDANSLTVLPAKDDYRLRIGFAGTPITAQAMLRVHPQYFEVATVSLDGPNREAVDCWVFVQLPATPRANVGGWLNVTWDGAAAVAVIALEERTDAQGLSPLRAVAHRSLGLDGRKAAIIACPTVRFLETVRVIEKDHGLPSPTLAGQWAKTSREVRKSWMITGFTAAEKRSDFAPDRVFEVARKLGVEYVVISLGWWNRSLGRYPVHTGHFPQGIASLKAVADEAHAKGLKLGIHVMTGSISKDDPLVTPVPDRRLCVDGAVDVGTDVDAASAEIPTRQTPSAFPTSAGYWAYAGMDVQIDDEIIRYGGLRTQPPFALTTCTRGAYGTRAAAHKAGAKVRHLTERYGWYVASPELAADVGRSLAEMIDQAGLDMVCFDGADVTADPQRRFFDAHQVPLGLQRHVRRDVVLVSNGTTHFGWHVMSRGGEDDAMSRGFQRWVDDYTVHSSGAYQRANFVVPDLSWVGIFPRTPTMTVARPDDIELVCARSLGFDAPIGWGLAACFGGASDVATFNRNGRKEEIAAVARTYEKLRLENCFSAAQRAPLQEQGTHWRLLSPDTSHPRHRLVPMRYLQSEIIRPAAPQPASWRICNDLGPQPLRVRVEALPSLLPYGSKENVVIADFAGLDFQAGGHPAARASLERTGETHPQAGRVARFRCAGPASASVLPRRLGGQGDVWAKASAKFPKKLDLGKHRALGLWVHGDGGGETLGIQLDIEMASCLHYYLPIDFTGWKYCELGEPEGDRVMDYFSYEKFALHDVPLDHFAGVTLMLLRLPVGKPVDLRIGRIEGLREIGGSLANVRTWAGAPPLLSGDQTAGKSLAISARLEPGQSLETGDLWGSLDPAALRVFDGDGNQLYRATLPSVPPVVPAGNATIRFSADGAPAARARVTVMLLGGR